MAGPRRNRATRGAAIALTAALPMFFASTAPGAGATATPPPAGFTAKFTGALSGTAQGGTSGGCVFTSRADPSQGPVPSPVLVPHLITMQWTNFTVKGKQASVTLLVGTPIAGNPSEPTPVPWQSGAPAGSAELTVVTPSGNFVTASDTKPASTDARTGVLTVDITLRKGKKKLGVKATFDCQKAGPSGDVPTT
ncbi:MAG TPA: hypothetical protein VEP49_09850 [Acidimicrobiia bacterium]|nr:hypothetical protein [Acidimicrobiia bacterium]